jgi:hypothetical protein
MRVVAAAYACERQGGRPDGPVREAAIAAFGTGLEMGRF